MIVTWISGGLGNQMYQYAVGRLLAEKTGQDLFFDLSFFKNGGQHNGYELERLFGIRDKSISQENLVDIYGWQVKPFLRRFVVKEHLSFLRNSKIMVDGQSDVSRIDSESDYYLFGYWQSEKILLDFRREVYDFFPFPIIDDPDNVSLLELISESNSVSIHVRRGDYISNKKSATHHSFCGIDYYLNSIEYVCQRVDNPLFFVFSDDIEWARSNLPASHRYVFVDNNKGAASYVDMLLMMRCEINIIANSTFSWWAGFLNVNENGLVVAPKRWFLNSPEGDNRIPCDWVRL